jgi:hypothetical protein
LNKQFFSVQQLLNQGFGFLARNPQSLSDFQMGRSHFFLELVIAANKQTTTAGLSFYFSSLRILKENLKKTMGLSRSHYT